jgi:hypothetical protein
VDSLFTPLETIFVDEEGAEVILLGEIDPGELSLL